MLTYMLDCIDFQGIHGANNKTYMQWFLQLMYTERVLVKNSNPLSDGKLCRSTLCVIEVSFSSTDWEKPEVVNKLFAIFQGTVVTPGVKQVY